jgi:CDP-glucose 4,6-dehydratase
MVEKNAAGDPLAPGSNTFRSHRVLVTGHTGFKGGWLTLWLRLLGAEVAGLALPPDTSPSLFGAIGVDQLCESNLGDIRNYTIVRNVLSRFSPDIVFHLAAQPLVRRSYAQPLLTLETNVIGSANILEAIRQSDRPCAVVVVTSDKCYANDGREHPHRETDPLGGADPYSMSKAAAELVVESYRKSYFAQDPSHPNRVALASARAGNVIGGGDWAEDRLIPDLVRSSGGEPARIRNPDAVRPWQHVLEPLSGYLTLARRLTAGDDSVCGPWNFGPDQGDAITVRALADAFIQEMESGSYLMAKETGDPVETQALRLSIEKAGRELDWRPRWPIRRAIRETVRWYREHDRGATARDLAGLMQDQIRSYAEESRSAEG